MVGWQWKGNFLNIKITKPSSVSRSMMILMVIAILQQLSPISKTLMTKSQSIWIDLKEWLPIIQEHFGSTLTVFPKMTANGSTKTLVEANTKNIPIQSQFKTKTTTKGEFKGSTTSFYSFKETPWVLIREWKVMRWMRTKGMNGAKLAIWTILSLRFDPSTIAPL